MRGKDGRCAFGDLARVFDEHRAARPQIVNHDFVVDDLMAHIDRSGVARRAALEGQLDRTNGSLDASTKSARRRKQNLEGHQSVSHLELSSYPWATFSGVGEWIPRSSLPKAHKCGAAGWWVRSTAI